MRQLLRFTHSRTPTKRYISVLKQIKKGWCSLEVDTIPQCKELTGGETVSPNSAEDSILSKLSDVCPPAAACYHQALKDLHQVNRISWRGTATELREALRETLDHLAPDEKVKSVPDFKLEPETKGPTMKQRVRFILRNRGQSAGAAKPLENAVDYVEEKFGNLVRSVYNISSGSVHSTTGKNEVVSIKRFVETVLIELLATKDTA